MTDRKGGFPKFTMDDYFVSEEGEVFNIKWNRKVKPQPNGKGYLRFHVAGKGYFVHREVALRYVPNPENKPHVNHKDGNKLNNRADNLEWVTNAENHLHAVKNGLLKTGEKCSWSKLTKENVLFIRQHPEIGLNELAKMFSVNRSTIKAVITRKSWKDV